MSKSTKAQPIHLILHGHFYQPPRENPWTGVVGRESSARPFHDWNDRIDHECYRPNAFGRVVDDKGRIDRVVNNYELLSFNFGPTLLSWLERHDPVTLEQIVAADRASVQARSGHGNAIAQAYNHMIMPHANARDRRTQIEWGLTVFRHHFGREAEAMWLPETAANHDVLEDLIDADMSFVILAPEQAGRVRPLTGKGQAKGKWKDVRGRKVDPSHAYRYHHRDGSGRGLAVFFYDGPLAQKIAFGDALEHSDRFLDHLKAASGKSRGEAHLIHAAVDGETAGHHNAWGDRVLAHVMVEEAVEHGYRLTNYGEYLELHPPTYEVELDHGPLDEGSSWSCAHGVGRWIRDCGCHIGGEEGWNQEWRAPLREALDLLRDRGSAFYEEQAGRFLKDVWIARDDYVQVILDPTPESRAEFVDRHGRAELSAAESTRALQLLELQHQLMLMYTSCGWFFDDVSGLESMQVLRYAARALDLWTELGGDPPGAGFLEILEKAQSNRKGRGNAAGLIREIVTTDTVDLRQVVIHALVKADDAAEPEGLLGGYRYSLRELQRHQNDGATMRCGHATVEHRNTGQSISAWAAVISGSDLSLHAGVRLHAEDEEGRGACERLIAAFAQGKGLETLPEHFADQRFDHDGLLHSGGREFLSRDYEKALQEFRHDLSQLHVKHHRMLTGLERLGLGYPMGLRRLSDLAVEWQLEEALGAAFESGSPEDYARITEFARELARRRPGFDLSDAAPRVSHAIAEAIADERLDEALRILDLSSRLALQTDLHRVQEDFLQRYIQVNGTHPDSEVVQRLARALGFSPRIFAKAAEASAPPSIETRS